MKYGRAKLIGIGLGGVLLLALNAYATDHKIENVNEAKWEAAPPMLPQGAKIEVLQGNPSGDSLYTVRLKFPANYKIPAHSHPKDECVTVVSGALYVGMGDKLDLKSAKALNIGGFVLMPANANHFGFTKKETVVLLHGIGPVEFKYVNPADDPRNRT